MGRNLFALFHACIIPLLPYVVCTFCVCFYFDLFKFSFVIQIYISSYNNKSFKEKKIQNNIWKEKSINIFIVSEILSFFFDYNAKILQKNDHPNVLTRRIIYNSYNIGNVLIRIQIQTNIMTGQILQIFNQSKNKIVNKSN
jgi:hypothetical protein